MEKIEDKLVLEKINKWLKGNIDQESKSRIEYLQQNNVDELYESFYKDLDFGTGGLRGIMGVGSNRMNKYTVGMATQGLSNYLKSQFRIGEKLKVAIAYDSRNNSRFFAETAANVFSANDVQVYLFDNIRPTPVLSFTIRHLGCNAGIVITASHNPKEYNGYKVYWSDGGQLINPHDRNVVAEVLRIKGFEEVKFVGKPELIQTIGEEIDKVYLQKVKELSLSPEVIKRQSKLKIVYTPLHGAGVYLTPKSLKNFGFENVSLVEEQCVLDGNFPTIKSPNPEESSALELAINKAKLLNADIVLATDPDADRVGVAVKYNNEYMLLNGNQTATLLIHYLIKKWKEKGKIIGNEMIVKTIVTTELLKTIAERNGVKSIDVLTGFKFIADIIKQNEGKLTFIGGGEESYGYLAGDFVRDKDAVISCCLIAEVAAYSSEQGKTLFDMLLDIYVEYGLYKEHLISIEKKGVTGDKEIKALMEGYRNAPPEKINEQKLVLIKDYLLLKEYDKIRNTENNMYFSKADVIQFLLADDSLITVRPSGTEPKIKYYFSIKGNIKDKSEYKKESAQLDEKIKSIIKDLI